MTTHARFVIHADPAGRKDQSPDIWQHSLVTYHQTVRHCLILQTEVMMSCDTLDDSAYCLLLQTVAIMPCETTLHGSTHCLLLLAVVMQPSA